MIIFLSSTPSPQLYTISLYSPHAIPCAFPKRKNRNKKGNKNVVIQFHVYKVFTIQPHIKTQLVLPPERCHSVWEISSNIRQAGRDTHYPDRCLGTLISPHHTTMYPLSGTYSLWTPTNPARLCHLMSHVPKVANRTLLEGRRIEPYEVHLQVIVLRDM